MVAKIVNPFFAGRRSWTRPRGLYQPLCWFHLHWDRRSGRNRGWRQLSLAASYATGCGCRSACTAGSAAPMTTHWVCLCGYWRSVPRGVRGNWGRTLGAGVRAFAQRAPDHPRACHPFGEQPLASPAAGLLVRPSGGLASLGSHREITTDQGAIPQSGTRFDRQSCSCWVCPARSFTGASAPHR